MAARGLESGSEIQTFVLVMSPRFRYEYDKIYEPLEIVSFYKKFKTNY